MMHSAITQKQHQKRRQQLRYETKHGEDQNNC